jgi:hypothetical protein
MGLPPSEIQISGNTVPCDDGTRCGRVVETVFTGTHCVETTAFTDCVNPGLPDNLRKKTTTTFTCQYVGIGPFGEEKCVGNTVVNEWQTDVFTVPCSSL